MLILHNGYIFFIFFLPFEYIYRLILYCCMMCVIIVINQLRQLLNPIRFIIRTMTVSTMYQLVNLYAVEWLLCCGNVTCLLSCVVSCAFQNSFFSLCVILCPCSSSVETCFIIIIKFRYYIIMLFLFIVKM
jgi:hypothetical protein